MEVMGWRGTLRRRWRLTLLLLTLTLAATAIWATKPGPYQSQSQVALLPSKQLSVKTGDNPYLSFGPSITLTADLVRRELTAPQTVARLASEGFSSSYQVVDDTQVAGPILDITVTGSSTSTVEHTLSGVTDAVASTLVLMQANIKPANQITSLVLSITPNAKLSLSKKLRGLVVVLALGALLTFALPQMVDASASWRRSRRRNSTTPSRQLRREPDMATNLDYLESSGTDRYHSHRLQQPENDPYRDSATSPR
jgi:hypothetical protein